MKMGMLLTLWIILSIAFKTVAARLFLINSTMKKLLKSFTQMSMKLYATPFFDAFPARLKRSCLEGRRANGNEGGASKNSYP